jgi:hypothetical protein
MKKAMRFDAIIHHDEKLHRFCGIMFGFSVGVDWLLSNALVSFSLTCRSPKRVNTYFLCRLSMAPGKLHAPYPDQHAIKDLSYLLANRRPGCRLGIYFRGTAASSHFFSLK